MKSSQKINKEIKNKLWGIYSRNMKCNRMDKYKFEMFVRQIFNNY